MAQTASIKQTIGRIASRQGKPAAQTWAFHRGYDVRWSKDGITVRPIAG